MCDLKLSETTTNITFVTVLRLDDPTSAIAVVNDLDITMPTLDFTAVAEDDYFSNVWGAFGFPTTFFIDEEGVMVAVQTVRAGEEGLKEILDQLGW